MKIAVLDSLVQKPQSKLYCDYNATCFLAYFVEPVSKQMNCGVKVQMTKPVIKLTSFHFCWRVCPSTRGCEVAAS